MLKSQKKSEDRRQRRSSEPQTALSYQLDRVVEDFGLDCCLIVDEKGEVVAGSPDTSAPLMQDFASLLPLLSIMCEQKSRVARELRRHRANLASDELTACVFRAGGRRLFIGAMGPEAVMNEIAIFRAITGARRIHGAA